VGHGFILCRMSKFPESFLIEFPYIKIAKGSVKDDDVAAHMGRNVAEITEERYEKGIATESERGSAKPGTGKPKPAGISLDEIDDNGWKVIKTLGEGKGAFTSQIYKTLGMSGTVFAKVSRKLDDMGVLGFSKAKLAKNWLNYYFLTDKGEQLFAKMYGELKGTTNLDLDGVYDMFGAAGWKHSRDGFELSVEAEGKSMVIMLVDAPDKAKILADLARTRYFICANDRLKNIVAQQAAKYARQTKNGYVLFIGTTKSFEERGEFERIEFA